MTQPDPIIQPRGSFSPQALALGSIAVFAALATLIATHKGEPFGSATLDLTGTTIWSGFTTLVAIGSGYFMAFAAPGLAWCRARKGHADFANRVFLTSLALQTTALTLCKVILGAQLDRWWLIATTVLLTVPAVFMPKIREQRFDLTMPRAFVESGALCLLLFVLLFPKIFFENFSGDGYEHFAYADSLRTHVLPHWDLENGYFGFQHRMLTFAYPSLLSILVLGDQEAAARLPFFLYFFLLMVTARDMVCSDRPSRRERLTLALGMFLLIVFGSLYATWHPTFADLAEPLTTGFAGTYFTVATLAFVRDRRRGWAVATALLAAFAVQSGLILVALVLAIELAYPRTRSRALPVAVTFGLGYSILLLGISFLDSLSPRGTTISDANYLLNYWFPPSDLTSLSFQLLLLVLMTGGLPLFATPLLCRRDDLAIRLFLVGWAYSLLILFSPRINPHYFLAPGVLFSIAFARTAGRDLRWASTYAAGVALILTLVVPPGLSIGGGSRFLGKRTRFEADSYPDAIRQSRFLKDDVPFGNFGRFGIGTHALIYYSERFPCKGSACDYLVFESEPPIPEGFSPLRRSETMTIMARNDTTESLAPYRKGTGCRTWLQQLYTAQRRNVESELTGPATLPWHICLATE